MNQFSASLWGDEAWAATLAIKPIIKIITLVAKDTSPPLYYLLLHTWMKIFGTSEVAIRSLSFLFYLLTALTVFLIGQHLWAKRTGLLAGLLVLVNPFLFTYAFEGRMYALLLLTSTLSVYFFLKKNRLGFILATAAALYTHHFAIFVVAWEGIWRLKEIWGRPFRKLIRGFSDFFLVCLLYLPWLYPLYYQISLVGSGFWLGKPSPQTFIEVVGRFLVGPNKGLAQAIALGAVVIALLLRSWLKDKKKSVFLLGWFFAPLVLTYFVSQFFQSIFFDRYLLIVAPAGALLIASLRRKKLTLILILVTVLAIFTVDYHYFLHPHKRPFRKLATFIKEEASDLTLINYNAAAHHLWESKYYGLKAPIYSPQPLPFYTGTALMEKDDVIETLPDEEKLGLITSASPEEVIIPGYEIKETKQFESLWFIWLEKS